LYLHVPHVKIGQGFLLGPRYGDLWIPRFGQLQEPLELGERKNYSYLFNEIEENKEKNSPSSVSCFLQFFCLWLPFLSVFSHIYLTTFLAIWLTALIVFSKLPHPFSPYPILSVLLEVGYNPNLTPQNRL